MPVLVLKVMGPTLDYHFMDFGFNRIARALFDDKWNHIADPKCKHLDDANKVFELIEVKDVVSWNALVTEYSQIGRFDENLGLFERIREDEIELNVVTWSVVISGNEIYGGFLKLLWWKFEFDDDGVNGGVLMVRCHDPNRGPGYDGHPEPPRPERTLSILS
ncbi:hypothetical protein BC332_16343 [Capsicum chinense]|nr:hypothetical protein BC332_16343 [Capsicum chinense]